MFKNIAPNLKDVIETLPVPESKSTSGLMTKNLG